jgi:phage FluMu gp28-like protein
MREECKVYRLAVDDAYSLQSDTEREAHMQAWANSILGPAIALLDPKRPTFLGEDFGRKSDLTVIAVGQEDQDMKLRCPILIELRNVPYKQQEQLLKYVAEHVPRWGKLAMDATGNGAYLAEVMVQGYGESLCEGIHLSEKWYAENLPKFKARFEDSEFLIPKDLDVRQDITAFQVVNGIPKLPKVKQRSKTSAKAEYRHGDAGIALVMLDYACRMGAVMYRKNYRERDTTRGRNFPKNKGVCW